MNCLNASKQAIMMCLLSSGRMPSLTDCNIVGVQLVYSPVVRGLRISCDGSHVGGGAGKLEVERG